MLIALREAYRSLRDALDLGDLVTLYQSKTAVDETRLSRLLGRKWCSKAGAEDAAGNSCCEQSDTSFRTVTC